MTKPPPKRGPKPTLNKGGGVRFRGMEDESVFIPLSKLDAHQAATADDCERCAKRYRIDDWIFRDARGLFVGVNCCASISDIQSDDPLSLGRVTEFEDLEGGIPLSQVLPNGKSKADMCLGCFQIPASNGICGC